MSDPVIWLLFAHVLSAFWLAAGAFGGAVVRAQIRRSGTLAEKVAGLRIAARMQRLFVVPGSVLAGVAGMGLIHARGWTFATGWISASLLLWLSGLAISVLVLLPSAGRLLRAGEAALAGGDAAAFHALAERKLPRILADVNATIVVALTLLMVFRPF